MKCDRTFSYKANLKKHTESQVHERKKMEYKCEKCTEIFARKEKLVKHNAFVHEGNKPAYKCDRTFSHKANLKKHRESQVHQQKKMEYKCEKCAEIFARKEKLAKHDAFVHEGNKPAYKCHLCGSTFSFKSLLARHKIQGAPKESVQFSKKLGQTWVLFAHLLVSKAKFKNYGCDFQKVFYWRASNNYAGI